MSEPRVLGRRLRAADPAATAPLDVREKARLRAAVVGAAENRSGRARIPWSVGLAATGVAIAAVVVVSIAVGPRHSAPAGTARGPAPALPAASAENPRLAVASGPKEPVVSKPRGAMRVRTLLRRETQAEPVGITRIMFTAPGGTRILWFAGRRDGKEDAS